MASIITIFLKLISSSMGRILIKLLSATTEIFKYLNTCKKMKQDEIRKKETKDHNSKAKKAADKGDLEDIFNL